MTLERALLIAVLVVGLVLLLELTGIIDVLDSVGPAN